MNTKLLAVTIATSALLAACSSAPGPTVYKHPETKSIVLLQGDNLVCEPLFRKAGFQKVDTGNVER